MCRLKTSRFPSGRSGTPSQSHRPTGKAPRAVASCLPTPGAHQVNILWAFVFSPKAAALISSEVPLTWGFFSRSSVLSQAEIDSFFETNNVQHLALIFEDDKSYIGREVTWFQLYYLHVYPVQMHVLHCVTLVPLHLSPLCCPSGNSGPVAVWEHCGEKSLEHRGRAGNQTGSDWFPILLPLLPIRQLHQTAGVSISPLLQNNRHHRKKYWIIKWCLYLAAISTATA